MFDHIGVVVSDFAKSKAFYSQALAPIGHSKVAEIMLDGGRKPSAGFCHEDGPDFWISQGEPTRPLHLAFRVSSRSGGCIPCSGAGRGRSGQRQGGLAPAVPPELLRRLCRLRRNPAPAHDRWWWPETVHRE
jgi:catechol 2,3-dioxygenase-like lactoylglutathione lyase family enzyme